MFATEDITYIIIYGTLAWFVKEDPWLQDTNIKWFHSDINEEMKKTDGRLA